MKTGPNLVKFRTGAGNIGNLSSSDPEAQGGSASVIANWLISGGTAACELGWASFWPGV